MYSSYNIMHIHFKDSLSGDRMVTFYFLKGEELDPEVNDRFNLKSQS